MSYTREELNDITQLALHRMAFSAPDSEASQDMRDQALEAMRQLRNPDSRGDSAPRADPGEDGDVEPPGSIRAKWTIDGAATLAEAARMTEAFTAELRQLAADGWELEAPVNDDYGYLVQAESGPRGDLSTRGDLAADEDLRWRLVSAVADLLAAANYGNMGDLEMPPGTQAARRELCELLHVTRNDVPRHAIAMMLYAVLYPGEVRVVDAKADPQTEPWGNLELGPE